MERVLEHEVMDDRRQAEAYARADFREVNERFVQDLLARFPACRHGRVLDLGCGPADIPVRLLRAAPAAFVLAIDASREMLRLARQAVARHSLGGHLGLACARVPPLPLPAGAFDAVISNSLLHHLPDPLPFWFEVRRVARSGAAVHVMDLARPPSADRAREIVEAAAADEDPVLKTDFYNSLLAAFTLEEVHDQLDAAGLRGLACEVASERHWLVSGCL